VKFRGTPAPVPYASRKRRRGSPSPPMGGGIGLIGFRSPSADGRKNVAHGDSRGEKARTMRLKSPGGATELS